MRKAYNIYCDESCHLPNDGQPLMVLGAVWCPQDKARTIAEKVREIKVKHGLPPFFEIKWTKVSPGKQEFYLDLVDYFLKEDDLHFRGLVAEKEGLDHPKFEQDHDTWYYKMYFYLLKVILSPGDNFYIYLDMKDTQSRKKITKLREVLCNNEYDFDRKIISRIQQVRSHEVEQVQLADLITGAVGYHNRGLSTNQAKTSLITKIMQVTGYNLKSQTLILEKKFNLFRWMPDWKDSRNG